MNNNNLFAAAMAKLQTGFALSLELTQLIVIAHQVSNETASMISDCASGLIDLDQLVAYIVRVCEKVGK